MQSDPSFMKKFIKPPEYNCIATYDGHADNVECVRPAHRTRLETGWLHFPPSVMQGVVC